MSRFNRPPLWLAAILAAAAILAGWDLWTWATTELARPYLNDFRGYYVGAEIGVRYGWSRIYELPLQESLGEAISGRRGNWVPFVNPPPMAWLMAPLTVLPFQAAYWLWDALLAIGFVTAGWLATRAGWQRAAVLLATFAVLPVTFAFMLGTSGLLNAIAVPVAWWLLRTRRDVVAGVVIGIALALKPQDAFLLPVALLLAGRWRAVVATAVIVAVLGAASLLTLGAAGTRTFLGTLAATESAIAGVNQRFTVVGIFGDHLATFALQALLAAAALVAGWRRRNRLELVIPAGVLASFFASPHLSLQDYSVLATACWLLLRLRPRPPVVALFALGYAAGQFATVVGPLPLFVFELGLLAALSAPGFEDDEDRRPEEDHPEGREDAADHRQHHLE